MTEELVQEWVAKAENDFASASILLSSGRPEVAEVVCFHAQQCAEKYLKALLLSRGQIPPRSHDLIALLAMHLPRFTELAECRPDCEALNPYAVDLRYPGEFADLQEAAAALAACSRIRQAVRQALDLEPEP